MCAPSSASAVTAEAFSPAARVRLEASNITRVRRSPLTLKLRVCAGGNGSAFWVTDSTAAARVEFGRVNKTGADAAAWLGNEIRGPAIVARRVIAASAGKRTRRHESSSAETEAQCSGR